MRDSFQTLHNVKSVRIPSYSGPHFPAFGLIPRISPYAVQMRKNADHNSEYGHFLCSVRLGILKLGLELYLVTLIFDKGFQC